MADISTEINAIRTARYGEEVRGSIVDALTAVNDQVEADETSAGASATAAAESAAAAAATADGLVDTLEEIKDVEENIEDAEAARVSAESDRVVAEAARVTAEQARSDAASGYVNQCAEYTNQARQYASSDNAMLSQSWAIGGTGTRYGEDSNNAKYWAEVAAQVVTEGGVASFNGRTGNVSPVAGDYDSTQITRGSGTVETALSAIEAELDSIETADTATNTVTFTSGDETDTSQISSWAAVTKLDTGETHATLFGKISTMFKNIRYLYKMLGTTSISGIGDSTVTGAISTLNGNLNTFIGKFAFGGRTSPFSAYQGRIDNFTIEQWKVDRVIFIQGAFRTTQAISAGAALATGGTSPLYNFNMPLLGMQNNTPQTLYINGTGSICAAESIPSNVYVNFTGVYIASA